MPDSAPDEQRVQRTAKRIDEEQQSTGDRSGHESLLTSQAADRVAAQHQSGAEQLALSVHPYGSKAGTLNDPHEPLLGPTPEVLRVGMVRPYAVCREQEGASWPEDAARLRQHRRRLVDVLELLGGQDNIRTRGPQRSLFRSGRCARDTMCCREIQADVPPRHQRPVGLRTAPEIDRDAGLCSSELRSELVGEESQVTVAVMRSGGPQTWPFDVDEGRLGLVLR